MSILTSREQPQTFAPRPAVSWRSQTVQNDVPANPCILRHHRTFALVLDKVQSNEGLPGAKFTARSSPRSPRSADSKASKLLICGLFQEGRVWHRTG